MSAGSFQAPKGIPDYIPVPSGEKNSSADFLAVRTALQKAGIDYESAEAQFVPSMEVEVDVDGARKVLRLIDALEDSDDVQNVYSNVDISDEVLAELDASQLNAELRLERAD